MLSPFSQMCYFFPSPLLLLLIKSFHILFSVISSGFAYFVSPTPSFSPPQNRSTYTDKNYCPETRSLFMSCLWIKIFAWVLLHAFLSKFGQVCLLSILTCSIHMLSSHRTLFPEYTALFYAKDTFIPILPSAWNAYPPPSVCQNPAHP